MDIISNKIQMERFMVIAMNKSGFIEEIAKQTNRDMKECIIIADCFDNHFFIGKKNKEKTVIELEEKLEISNEDANQVYEIVSKIIATAIKDRLKHPFGSNDNE